MREPLASYVRELGLSVAEHELERCLAHADVLLDDIERLGETECPERPLRHSDRDPGRRPVDSEDPCNAILRYCEVKGSDVGRLAGWRIGVKDSIPVAGVPMTAGVMDDPAPIPAEDPVVIERLLDAGATISAKTNVGALFGETRNPHDPRFSPGYSSSGSAAAVVAGLVDAALGTDGAGSVRIPAAWCGVVGMKATHGAVPTYYGQRGHRTSEVGPITRSVAESAAMLDVMMDRRRTPGTCADAATHCVEGLRIGVIAESATGTECTAGTLRAFERAQRDLAALGCTIQTVSVPLWGEASSVLQAITSLWHAATAATHWLGDESDYEGRVDDDLRGVLTESREWSLERASICLVGEHVRRRGIGTSHYVRAQNLRVELRRQLDVLLSEVDVLATPTTPSGPFELDDERLADPRTYWPVLRRDTRNTAPLNLSGHPALSVPSGRGDDDLPTGLQLVGRAYDEQTLYRVAHALEAVSSSSPGRTVSRDGRPSG